jgi:hypothetical protein
MNYNRLPEMYFSHQSHAITNANNAGNGNPAMQTQFHPKWQFTVADNYVPMPTVPGSHPGSTILTHQETVAIQTEDAFHYLQTVLGARQDAHVADLGAVDNARFVDPRPTVLQTNHTHNGWIYRPGDYDVYEISAPTSAAVLISLQRPAPQLGGTSLDPVLMIYQTDSAGLTTPRDYYYGTTIALRPEAGYTFKLVVGADNGGTGNGSLFAATGKYQLTIEADRRYQAGSNTSQTQAVVPTKFAYLVGSSLTISVADVSLLSMGTSYGPAGVNSANLSAKSSQGDSNAATQGAHCQRRGWERRAIQKAP